MDLVISDRALDLAGAGATATVIDLSQLKIGPCVGCFGCWVKTPGKCVIRDDACRVYPYLAKSTRLLLVSRVRYGSYDTVMKTMLERAIPVQQAFIRILDGETHHIQRRVVPKNAVIMAYGDPDEEEREIFRQVIARNARNMNFETYRVVFCREEQVQDFVEKELKAWGI